MLPSCEGASSEAVADLRSGQDKVYLHQPEIPEEISFAVDGKPGLLFLFLTFQSRISNRQKLGRASLTFSAAFMKSRIGKCASLNYLLLAVWFVSAAGLTTAPCFSLCWPLTQQRAWLEGATLTGHFSHTANENHSEARRDRSFRFLYQKPPTNVIPSLTLFSFLTC